MKVCQMAVRVKARPMDLLEVAVQGGKTFGRAGISQGSSAPIRVPWAPRKICGIPGAVGSHEGRLARYTARFE
jgi:hypothetical protein